VEISVADPDDIRWDPDPTFRNVGIREFFFAEMCSKKYIHEHKLSNRGLSICGFYTHQKDLYRVMYLNPRSSSRRPDPYLTKKVRIRSDLDPTLVETAVHDIFPDP
jgi:hypothetical protein